MTFMTEWRYPACDGCDSTHPAVPECLRSSQSFQAWDMDAAYYSALRPPNGSSHSVESAYSHAETEPDDLGRNWSATTAGP